MKVVSNKFFSSDTTFIDSSGYITMIDTRDDADLRVLAYFHTSGRQCQPTVLIMFSWFESEPRSPSAQKAASGETVCTKSLIGRIPIAIGSISSANCIAQLRNPNSQLTPQSSTSSIQITDPTDRKSLQAHPPPPILRRQHNIRLQ